MKELLNQLQNNGIQFTIYNGYGLGNSDLDINEVLEYISDPAKWQLDKAVAHYQVSPEIIIGYFNWEEGGYTCMATTKTGKRCKNSVNNCYDVRFFNPDTSPYCKIHKK